MTGTQLFCGLTCVIAYLQSLFFRNVDFNYTEFFLANIVVWTIWPAKREEK